MLHYGIAGNADPQLQIGDVTIPQYWAHTGLWNWQVNNLFPHTISSTLRFRFFSRDKGEDLKMSFLGKFVI